jgi:hypothetical protein
LVIKERYESIAARRQARREALEQIEYERKEAEDNARIAKEEDARRAKQAAKK